MSWFRRRRTGAGLERVQLALAAERAAKTRRQKRRALLAIAGAQAEIRRRGEDALDLELLALVNGMPNWCEARVDFLEAQLTDAQSRLIQEMH